MRWVTVEDTVWPVDVEGRTQWMMRNKAKGYTSQSMAAASVMSAYAYLTDPSLPQKDAIAALKRARRAAKETP